MTKSPLVSILMPLYNHQNYVEAAIESVITQSYTNWELIICNDSSTDNSLGLAANYLSQNIHIINKSYNQGVSDALNSAALLSKGDLICWLSSDDFYHPHKIQAHVDTHTNNPNCHVSIAPFGYADMNSNHLAQYAARKHQMPEYTHSVARFLYGNYINGLAVCYSRAALAQTGMWCTKYPYVQDVQKWISLFRQFKPEHISSDIGLSITRLATTSNTYADLGVSLDEARMLYNQIITYGPFAFAAGVNPNSLRSLISTKDLEALYISTRAILDKKNFLGKRGLYEDVIKALKWWFKQNSQFDLLEKLISFSHKDVELKAILSKISKDIINNIDTPRSSAEILINHYRSTISDTTKPDLTNFILKTYC